MTGSTAELAAAMRQYAAAGISHVQLVLDPITVEAIEEFASGARGAGPRLTAYREAVLEIG